MLKLYSNIRDRRRALNMSQDELAKKIGYSGRSMIAHIEKGDVDLPQSKILLIADALNVRPGDLMGWDKDSITLTPSEDHLISQYRQLNDEGQKKATDYVDDLVDTGKYQEKENSVTIA